VCKSVFSFIYRVQYQNQRLILICEDAAGQRVLTIAVKALFLGLEAGNSSGNRPLKANTLFLQNPSALSLSYFLLQALIFNFTRTTGMILLIQNIFVKMAFYLYRLAFYIRER